MKKIAIIPARAGSKGLPNKNILLLGNKPLMAYTIEAAINSREFEKVIVSTDSLEYKEIAENYGAEVLLRGEKLSNDTATSYMVIEDVLKRVEKEYDYFMLLQPTSPFRNEIHIKESINLFEKNTDNFNFLVSMEESEKTSKLIKIIDEDRSLKNYDMDFSKYTRQQYKEYFPNGAIFIGKIENYLKQKHFFSKDSLAYFMNKEDSIDIDDRLDFEIAIAILTKKNKAKILETSIKAQIKEKEKLFKEVKDITLIGHSIMDRWQIKEFKNHKVNNLGISGISTREYQNYILDKNKIEKLGEYIFLMLGTNDIVDKNLTDEDIVRSIEKFIDNLCRINSKIKIYFLEMTSVAFRLDRSKQRIYSLNHLIKERIYKKVNYIELNKYMTDQFNNLCLDYTDDGLHLNLKGYRKLEEILDKELDI